MATVRKRIDKKTGSTSWQLDYFDPSGKRIRKSFKLKKHAEAELGKRVSLMAEGRYLDVKRDLKVTLGDLIEKYRENYGQDPGFLANKEFSLKFILDHFDDRMLISKITYGELETFRNSLRKKQCAYHDRLLAPATVNRIMSTLRHLFSKGVEWELIETHPFKKGRSLMLKENNKRLRYLSKDEISRLLAVCPEHLYNIVLTAINTGMRKEEILSLKWNQIKDGFIFLTKTKNGESRQVPINNALDQLFRTIRQKQQLKSQYVFTFNGGDRVKDVKRSFHTALTAAGITDFRFHDLRHTFASHLLLNGGALADIRDILGHKDMTMTLRYAHLSGEHKRKAVNLLNNLTDGQQDQDQKIVNIVNIGG